MSITCDLKDLTKKVALSFIGDDIFAFLCPDCQIAARIVHTSI